jgi:membrane protease YdiL (CAAX protease family)
MQFNVQDDSEETNRLDKIALLFVLVPVLILMPIYYINHNLASNGLLLLAFWLFYSSMFFKRGDWGIGIRSSEVRESFAITKYFFILGILVVFPLSILIESKLPPLDGFSSSFLSNPTSYVFYTLILSPIIEEFVFRGVLQYRLSWFIPNYLANGVTSLAFVMIHWIPGELWVISTIMILRFIRSYLYGHVFTKTQNFIHSWTMHVIFNLYEPVFMIILLVTRLLIP